MDRKNYDPEVISTFDIIGCYFIDIYYNHLYLTANDIHNKASRNERAGGGRATSLTEEYKNAVTAYMQGVTKDEKYYKQTVTGMQKFYQTFTKYGTITLTEFINRIINTYLPVEYASNLRSEEKEFFLNDIISSVIKEFSVRAVDITHLRQIIDNHNVESNTRLWVDEFVDLQIIEREKIFNKFTQKRMGGRGQQYEKVDMDTVKSIVSDRDKLWAELAEKIKEIRELNKNLSDSKKLVMNMYGIIKKYEEERVQLRALVDEKQAALDAASSEVRDYLRVGDQQKTYSDSRTPDSWRNKRRTTKLPPKEESIDAEERKPLSQKESVGGSRFSQRGSTPKTPAPSPVSSPKPVRRDSEENSSASEEENSATQKSSTASNDSAGGEGKSKSGSRSASSEEDSEETDVEKALKRIEEQETPRVGFRLEKRARGRASQQ